MKIFFPLHLDGNNRGCEAIAKGTAKILGFSKNQLIGFSQNIELDNRLGLGNLYTLIPATEESSVQKLFRRVKFATYILSKEKRKDYIYAQKYRKFLDRIGVDDIMFSTGGDMMCYEDNQVIYTNNYVSKKKKKTVLWGCSIGKKDLTPRKINTLKKFSLIMVRESITMDLMKEIGLKNVFLFPDPAFVLLPETCQLPELFSQSKVIGINLSNFVGHDVSENSIIGKNICNMVDYILSSTDYNILFIPHVLWRGQDDRILCNILEERFRKTKRIQVLDTEVFNYCQIRFIISKCELFIGSRTHSVISAYSMCIPTLALGYSVKSRGIVKDLGLHDETVIDCLHMKDEYELTNAFKFLYENQDNIKNILTNVMPNYILRCYEAKKVVSQLL